MRLVSLFAFGAALLTASAAHAEAYRCQLLMANYDGTSEPLLIDSAVGRFELDGKGGYTTTWNEPGKVTVTGKIYRFTSGAMMGITAALKTTEDGRTYMHIGNPIEKPPTGDPEVGHHMCFAE